MVQARRDGPPSEFEIWSPGVVDTTKGQFLFDEAALSATLAAYADYGNRLSIDYNHGQVIGTPRDGIAAGSFALEGRHGSLWATDVRWTEQASRELTAKEWLHFSPCFEHEADTGRIVNLINIALTNTPATKKSRQLVSASRKMLKSMSEDEKNALLTAYNDAVKALVDAGIPVPELDGPESASATAKTDPAPAPSAALNATLSLIKSLASRFDRLESSIQDAPIREMEAKAVASGLDPKMVKAVVALARTDMDSARLLLAHAPKSRPALTAVASASPLPVALSRRDTQISKSMGVSASDFEAARIARESRVPRDSFEDGDDA